jgi:DNA primase
MCDSDSALFFVALHYGHTNKQKEKEKICCPFHADDTPSLLLDYSTDTYHCFGCGAHGDAMEYVQGMEQSKIKALSVYAKITHGKATQKHRTYTPRTQDTQALAQAKDFYGGLSSVDWYSLEREEEHEQALVYMTARGVDVHTMTRHGVKVTYDDRYPVVVPLYDNGGFCGYVRRTFDKKSERKYMYNRGFSRATSVIGQYGSKDVAFVCEGIFDLMALSQAGLHACSVALMGCTPTREQIAKLKGAGITKVVSCLDMDEAGERGTEELQKHFKIKRLVLPDGVSDVAEIKTFDLRQIVNNLFTHSGAK